MNHSLPVKALATSRLTRLIVDDKITEPIRKRIVKDLKGSGLDYLVTCKSCSSIWAAGVVASGIIPKRAIEALALSELVILGDQISQKYLVQQGW